MKTPPKSGKTLLGYSILKTFKFPRNVKKGMEFVIYSQRLGVFKVKYGKRRRKEAKCT